LLLAMLPAGPTANGFDAVVFNNLAWADLLLDEPRLVEEARSMSARAYRLLPWEPTIAGTFGCIEALHGDARQALAVLERIRAPQVKAHRAAHLAAMAAAHARLEQRTEVQVTLQQAERVDPACPLLSLVRARLANVLTELC
jgi:Flp pilus assembly protein TadD